MHDVSIALITIAGSVASGLIVAWGSFLVARWAGKQQRRRDLERAMGNFLSALVRAVAELHDLPAINEKHPAVVVSTLATKVGDAIAPGRSWVLGRQQLTRVLGPRPFAVVERVVDAASHLRVLDPGAEMTTAMDEALDYLIVLGSDRSPAQLKRWPTIRRRVEGAIAETRSRYLAD